MPRNGSKKRFSSSSSSNEMSDATEAVKPSSASDHDAGNAAPAPSAGGVVCQSDDEGNVIIEVSDAFTPLTTFANVPEGSEVDSGSPPVSAAATDAKATDAKATDAKATDANATDANATDADTNATSHDVAAAATTADDVAATAAATTTDNNTDAAATADINVAPNSAPPKYGCLRSLWQCFKGACTLMCCCCCRRRRRNTTSSLSPPSSNPVPEK